MMNRVLRWLQKPPAHWAHLRTIPASQMLILLAGVFLLFSVNGFYVDIMDGGVLPYGLVFLFAVMSGLNAAAWVLTMSRLPVYFTLLLFIAQFFYGLLTQVLARLIRETVHPQAVPATQGLHFAATAILFVVLASYIFFTRYMRITGRESFRIKNELELAHSIQKTLVPPVHQITPCFEIYGISHPSEKVGGDLVDVVALADGNSVAYLADIAGHGLQAGILMGMLKTAARTALTDSRLYRARLQGESMGLKVKHDTGEETLSILMERLNTVLPQVKEAHMYATFTALRLDLDGAAFYGMAASPPLLHWSAGTQGLRQIEEQQFPLGLLPVSGFGATRLTMEPGDLALIATDGILEVASAKGAEFGADALGSLVAQHVDLPLPELAAVILKTVRAFGRQVDDQTLLLVRRRSLTA